MRHKTLILIAAPVLLILIAALAVPAVVDVNRYRPQIEAKLEEHLGRDVSLGNMRLTLIPLTFRVENAVFGEAAGFQTGKPFAQAQTLYVKPKLVPLLRRDIQIASIELNRPSVEIVRNRDGVWNFATLATRKEEGQPISIGELKIDDGQVAITDLQQNQLRTVYDHIDLTLEDFAPDKRFFIDGRAHISGDVDQTIAFKGKVGPIQRDNLGQTSIDASYELNQVSLAELQQVLNIQALDNSDAVLTGSGEIKNDQGVLVSNGKLDAATPRVRGVDIGYPISIRYDINGDLNQRTIQIQKADFQLGQTPLSVKGNVDAKSAPAVIDLNVASSQASLADAARLAAAFGLAFTANTKADGILNLNVHARGPVNKLVMDGQASVSDVDISGGELRQPVHVDKVGLTLTPTTVQSNEFTAAAGGTKVQVQFALFDYASDNPQLKGSIGTGNAQVEELLNIAQAYGISATEGVKGSGTVQLNVQASGPVKAMDKVTYNGSGALRNATFNLTSLAKPVTVRNADLRFSANSIILDNVNFSVGETVARGTMTVHNPAAPQVEFSLAADKINVAEWQALTQSKPNPNAATTPAKAAAPKRPSSDSLIRRSTGTGRVTAATVVYDDLILTNVDSTVKLDKGLITMSPVTADMYGGRQVGTVVLDARSEPAAYSVDLKLQHVDANKLLSSISPMKNALYGSVSADANTRFTSAGGARNIVRSLDGRVTLNLTDGAIANVDLLHQMSAIAKFIGATKPVEPDTKVTQLAGDFDIHDGVAHTNNLRAALAAGSFAATGTIDLGQQKMNLRVTTTLSKQYSDEVGGTGIGGFMTSAVANQNGELVVPIIITGTFQDPRFAPDLQKIAEMKLQHLLPSGKSPGELGGAILDRLLRTKPEAQQPEATNPPQQQEQQQPKQPSTLERILGDIQKRIQK
jgi:uncharacterized protein involved in outer membrane biogenesis